MQFLLADAQELLSDPAANAAPETSDSPNHVATAHPQAHRFQDKLQTFSPAQFDTVIDTFGLCSHEDPKTALQVANPATTFWPCGHACPRTCCDTMR